MSDQYILPNGLSYRTINAQVLVERIKLPGYDDATGMVKTPAGIFIPNPEREDPTAIGIVRAVGYLWKPGPKDENGERTPVKVPLDIEVGMKCSFLWFYAETHTNQMVKLLLGENFILLKWEDIGLCWPGDEDHIISDMKSMGR